MARKNPYDAPAIPPFGGPLPLGGALRTGPPADDQTEVALRRSRGKGVLPVDDETNFGDIEGAIAGGGELEAEVLKVDPRALAQRLASGALPEESQTGRRGLADDEPTLLGGPAAPAMDPKELAKVLAAHAKAKLGITNPPEPQPAPVPAPVPTPAPAPVVAQSPTLGAVAAPMDPAALARKLALEAKARLTANTDPRLAAPAPTPVAAPAPAPVAPPPADREDPVALARRLAAEAKARMTPQPAVSRAASLPPTPASPDPVERAPLRTPPPAPPRASTTPPAPARLASRAPSVPPAPSRAVTPPPAEDEGWDEIPATPAPAPERSTATPAPARGGRLADRAPRPPTRTSAAEALKRMTDPPAPARQARPPRAPEPSVLPEPARVADSPDGSDLDPVDVVEPPRFSDPEPYEHVTAPAPPPRVHDPEDHLRQIAEVLPDAIVESERPVRRPEVFRALWEAHQARALKDGHLELAGAATLLLTMITRLPPGGLIGVKITRAGKGWAVFVDASDGAILAVVPRPEVYLAGLQ